MLRMPAAHPDEARGLALREAKVALRNRILLERDNLTEGERAQKADAIVARLCALPAFVAARTVLLTSAFRSEWATAPLIHHALSQGKIVALPRVNVASRMLELRRVVDFSSDVAPGYRGIPEPLPGAAFIEPPDVDWVLVPGVAFDRAGRRLGYGGGFYDRLLPLISPDAPRVAGAYALQLVDRVPAAPHDVTVDAIVTESEMIAVPPKRDGA
ncbi:MAG: 5-formyltetrahydrofolate cyclo-ligase [Pseudomonadota bacterium]|nr:5-formyltetrahydrofolate cyclo-ligase [Pseudomonadota bacterium]